MKDHIHVNWSGLLYIFNEEINSDSLLCVLKLYHIRSVKSQRRIHIRWIRKL